MAWQRKIPFGYQVRNGRINCHPEEAELVRAIFSRYLLGGSYSQIADEMTQQGVRYHQHNAQWNKHMVKRILENERYLGMDGYPQLVTDEEFLAVRLRRGEQNTYAPCPSEIIPIRDKAVCALCGEKMARDTKSHGRPRWRCKNPECGGSVYLDDSIILERVVQKLKVLAHSPACIQLPKAAPASTDALRIENELALCFNRADINPEYMKTLIMAAAAERYAGLNDPTPAHRLALLRQKLELEPENEETLWELFESAVTHVCIGKGGEISLHSLCLLRYLPHYYNGGTAAIWQTAGKLFQKKNAMNHLFIAFLIPYSIFSLVVRPCVQQRLRGCCEDFDFSVRQLIQQRFKLHPLRGLALHSFTMKNLIHRDMIAGHQF